MNYFISDLLLNVGCMLSYMDYTPRNFEYLCGVLDKRG